MKSLILFNLKRRFYNKSTVIIILLQFLLIFCFFHLNLFDEQKISEVYIDSSVRKYLSYFGELKDSSMRYLYGNNTGKQQVILHLNDNKWTIYSHCSLDKTTLAQIKNDILQVVKKQYSDRHRFMQGYIREYEKQQIEVDEVFEEGKSDELLIILISGCYFLLLGYGNLISSEIINQKNLQVLPLILNNMDIREHFYANIIYGYLVPLVRIISFLLCLAVNLIIGVNKDNFSLWLNEIPDITNVRIISVSSLILTGLLMLTVLVIVQIVLLLVCSGFQNNNQVGNFLLIINILGLLLYYFCLNNLNEQFLKTTLSAVLSYLPVFSMIFMGGRLLLGLSGKISGILAIVVNIVFLYSLVTKSINVYKKNLLC
ncbi:MAG: hypothetical protein Q4C64_06045 [Erysipelotrichia bacterium]|nr:hypothetical protein [Erysipelotrichia bacterium]